MSNFIGKQLSSRPIRLDELDYAGSGTQATTPMSPQTYQVYVVSDVRGYLSFGSTTPTTTSRDTATVELIPNVAGTFWTVTPGQVLSFSSSSTSSGSVLITECV